jgi:two-component system cell cycle sensor histidine kinase/response regulator CckA
MSYDDGPREATETILVVEDEDIVREVATEMLVANGYQVLGAKDGCEALEICTRYPGPINLMLTDVVMPRVSGRELADKVLQLRPKTKVLYMSGYSSDVIEQRGVLDKKMPFLQKPFTLDSVSRRVREVLERGTTP